MPGVRVKWSADARDALREVTDAYLRRRAKARIEKYARSRKIPVITCQLALPMIEETVGREKLGAGWDTLLARTRFEPAQAPAVGGGGFVWTAGAPHPPRGGGMSLPAGPPPSTPPPSPPPSSTSPPTGAVSPYTAYSVSWNLTQRCNLECAHCYMSAFAGADTRGELTTGECRRVLDEIAQVNPNVFLILTGGEPLLRRDIWEIAAYAADKRFTTVLGTNGVLLSEPQ